MMEDLEKFSAYNEHYGKFCARTGEFCARTVDATPPAAKDAKTTRLIDITPDKCYMLVARHFECASCGAPVFGPPYNGRLHEFWWPIKFCPNCGRRVDA